MLPPELREQPLISERIESPAVDWVGIAVQLAKRSDILSLKILEKLYISPGHPFILDELVRSIIKPYDRKKKMTVWRRVVYLKSLGLLDADGGKPMSVYPLKGIDKKPISHLLKLCYGKMIGDLHVHT